MKPILFIFSGLPGSGKSTLAKKVANIYNAVYLRIDTIEQGLRDLCNCDVQGEGYRLSYRIAADNLQLGICVVADSCNPIELTRREWEAVAIDNNASYINIEIICSDKVEHQRRVETRPNEIKGLHLPTWKEVEAREYHPWNKDRIIIDTAHQNINESNKELLDKIQDFISKEKL